jgi:ribose transport system substrate-binding protein
MRSVAGFGLQSKLEWKNRRDTLMSTRMPSVVGALVTLTALAALTACSSSGSSTSAAQSTAGSSSTSAGATSSVVAAEKIVQQAEQVPSSINQTTPLKTAPPKGKTFIYLQCEVVQCQAIGVGIQAATKALGWNYRSIPYENSNPATLVSAMQQALQYHPVGVSFVSLPEAVWSSEIPVSKAANAVIIPYAVGPSDVNSTVPAFIGGDTDYKHYADMMANWFIASSNGTGHALVVDVPEDTTLKTFADAFSADVASGCPQCSVTTINESVPDSEDSQLISDTVSTLQKNPSIGYAITVDGPFFQGLPSALAAAGLSSRVKIGGQGGGSVNLADVKAGTEAAYTGGALASGGWLVLDAALRHLEGMPIPDGDGGLPTQLLVTGGNFAVSPSYNEPSNYASQFEKLWHIS